MSCEHKSMQVITDRCADCGEAWHVAKMRQQNAALEGVKVSLEGVRNGLAELSKGVTVMSVSEKLESKNDPQASYANTKTVLADVHAERVRQESLRISGKFTWTCEDMGISDPEKLAVLAEEFGEVSRIVADHLIYSRSLPETSKHLRDELIQVAAVCVAWCEALDEEELERNDGKGRTWKNEPTRARLCYRCGSPSHPSTREFEKRNRQELMRGKNKELKRVREHRDPLRSVGKPTFIEFLQMHGIAGLGVLMPTISHLSSPLKEVQERAWRIKRATHLSTTGARIREMRLAMSLTQEQLARLVPHMTQADISNIERGRTRVGMIRAKAFANVFGVPLSAISSMTPQSRK